MLQRQRLIFLFHKDSLALIGQSDIIYTHFNETCKRRIEPFLV